MKRWIFSSVAIIVLLVVVAVIYLYTPAGKEYVKKQITKQITNATGYPASIEHFQTNYLSSTEVGGITIQDTATGAHLRVNRISLDYRLFPALKGVVQVDSILSSGVQLDFSSEFISQFGGQSEAQEQSQSNWSIQVEYARVDSSHFHYVDSKNRMDVLLQDVNVEYLKNEDIQLSISDIDGSYQGTTLQNLSLSASGRYEEGEWVLPGFDITGIESQSNIGGSFETAEGGQSFQLTLNGYLSEDITDFIILLIDPNLGDHLVPGGIRMSAGLNYAQDSFRYTASLGIDTLHYDTLRFTGIQTHVAGNSDSLHVKSLRTNLGGVDDTLHTSGSIDWERQAIQFDLSSHLTSLAYFKHLFNIETPLDSDFDLNASIRLPYGDIVQASGSGSLILQNPEYEDIAIAPVRMEFSLADTAWRADISHNTNKLLLESTGQLPLEFRGNLSVTDFSDIGRIFNISQQSSISVNFSGSYDENQGIAAEGNLDSDIFLYDNDLPITAQVPFDVRQTEIEIQDGRIAVADLPQLQLYAGVMLQPRLNALVELRELTSSNSGGLLRFTASRDSVQITGESLVEQVQIGPYLQFVTNQSVTFGGMLSGSARYSFGPDTTGINGDITLADVELPRAQQRIDSLTAQILPAPDGVNLTLNYHMRSESTTWVDGYIPFSNQRDMAVNITPGRLLLSTFNPFLPESWFLAGYLTPDLTVNGTYSNPAFNGNIRFDSVYVQWDDRREPLQQITGNASFEEQQFTIDEIALRYLNYPVRFSGTGDFEPSIDMDIAVGSIGTARLHYSRPASDSAYLGINDIPLDLLQDFIPAQIRSEGTLNAEMSYLSTGDTLLLTSSGTVDPELSGDRSDWLLQWDGAYTGRTLNLNRFRFGNTDEHISLSGFVQNSGVTPDSTDASGADLDLRLQIQDFQLSSLNTFNRDWNFESGMIQGALAITGSTLLPEFRGSITGSSMAWVNAFQDFRIENGNFRWEFAGRELNLQRTAVSMNSIPLSLTGKVMFGEDHMVDANITGTFAQSTPVEIRMQHNAQKDLFRGYAGITDLQITDVLTAVASDQQISALGDVTLKIGGTMAQPQMTLQSDFREIVIGDIPFENFSISSRYADHAILLDTLRLGRENAFLQGTGKVSGTIDLEQLQWEGIGDTVALTINSDAFPLSAVNEIIPENYNLAGNAFINFSYSRSPGVSDMSGSFEVSEFSSDLPYFQQRVTGGHLLANFDGSTISFADTYFIIHESRQNLSGSITLKPGAGPEYGISLKTERVELSNPGEVTLTLAPSDLRMETTAGEPAIISGTIRVSSFRYTKPVANIQLLSLIGTRTVRPERFTEQMLEDIRLNLSLQMLQNAEVENNLAELDFNADIQLSGPLLQPRYSGRVTSESGEIFYLRKTFNIEEARVLFGGRPGLNPDLNITAQTVVQPHENVDNIDYTITLNITGSLSNPNVQFSAEPPNRPVSNETLTQSDIIGLLTIGRPRPQLASAEENSSFTQTLMRQASRYSSAQIASVLEYQVKRLLDLDRVSIEGNLFSLSGSDQPIFTAQKNFTNRLSLTYSTSIGESNMQGLRLNYRIGEHFYIVTETMQREETEYGVDLKYKIQF